MDETLRGPRPPHDQNEQPPSFAPARQGVDRLIARAQAADWPDPGEIWDAVSRDGRGLYGAPYGSSLSERAVWAMMAVDAFGEEEFQRLKRMTGPSAQFWPENCDDGREIVCRHGIQVLESLGMPEAAHSRIAGPGGPR